MAWENFKVEQQRLQLVQAYLSKEISMTEACKRYGVSRKTGHKWLQRFLEHGETGLIDLSRRPETLPYRYTPEQIEKALELKYKSRKSGPKKILEKLLRRYPDEDWPSASRLHQIFKDNHLVNKRRARSRVPATNPLGGLVHCNDTWSVDLKGWFLTGDESKCEPLTIMDSVSRFLIRCIHLPKHSAEYVWPVFDEAFKEYGLPLRVRSDNGPPFGSTGAGRLTKLSVNLIKAGVMPEWIRPGHPEENGRHERFHLTLKEAVANPVEATLMKQLEVIERFIEEYNFDRPHEALDMKTPGECYMPSPRTWNGVLKSPEYDRKIMDVRKVCQSGCVWIHQTEYYIGQALSGEYIGLKGVEEGRSEAYYGPVYLGLLDLRKGLEKPKLKTRRQR